MPARLRVVDADATPEEVAAIVAALGVLRARRREPPADETLHEWVRLSRLRARRSPLRRGSWRLAERVSRWS